MGEFWVINSDEKLNNVIARIQKEWEDKKWLQIQIKDGKAATKQQRDWMYPVFRVIAKNLTERSGEVYKVEWVKTYLKRKFGLKSTKADPETGEPVPYLVSTEDYSRGEKCFFNGS